MLLVCYHTWKNHMLVRHDNQYGHQVYALKSDLQNTRYVELHDPGSSIILSEICAKAFRLVLFL